jgi:hypothetical protein
MESEQSQVLGSPQKEYPPNWKWKHPNINPSFFEAIPEPEDKLDPKGRLIHTAIDDAHLKMCCHMHSQDDFAEQAEIAKDELELLLENQVFKTSKEAEKNEALISEKREDIIRFKKSKRFHHNARWSYWFWMQCESDLKIKK